MILLGPTEENIECPEGLDSIGLLLEVSWADAAAVAEACKGFGLTANPNPRPWPDAHGFGKARCQEKEEQGQRMKWRPSFYLQRKVPAVLLTHANRPRAWTFGEAQQKHEIPRSALAA